MAKEELFFKTQKDYYGNPQLTVSKKTIKDVKDEWFITEGAAEHSLEMEDGDISGPWPEVVEAYSKQTSHGTPECVDCEIEMMVIDRGFKCPSCTNRAQVGTREYHVYCVRDDVRRGYMDEVEIPDSWLPLRYNKPKDPVSDPFDIFDTDDSDYDDSLYGPSWDVTKGQDYYYLKGHDSGL